MKAAFDSILYIYLTNVGNDINATGSLAQVSGGLASQHDPYPDDDFKSYRVKK